MDGDFGIASPGSSLSMYPRSDLHFFQLVSTTLFSKKQTFFGGGWGRGGSVYPFFHAATSYLKNLLLSAVKHTVFDDPECSFLIRQLGSVLSMSRMVEALWWCVTQERKRKTWKLA